MDFIEQNKHLLWNWDSWECIPIKIIKGKWIFIKLFLIFLTPILLWKMAECFAVTWHRPNNRKVCFRRKAFKKSDTALALRRGLSIFPCITLVSFINVYDEYFCIWCGSPHSHRMFVWDNAFLIITHQFQMRFLTLSHLLCNMKCCECHLMQIIKG